MLWSKTQKNSAAQLSFQRVLTALFIAASVLGAESAIQLDSTPSLLLGRLVLHSFKVQKMKHNGWNGMGKGGDAG